MKASEAERALRQFANPKQAKLLAGFFKTGKGQYGEGDVFWGVMVPQTRSVMRRFADLSLSEIKKLLHSPVHEVRLMAVLMLVHQFQNGDEALQSRIVKFYLSSTKYINNWDLVDLSAPKILGEWLTDKPRQVLYTLARSKNLWERRIAILSTFAFINRGESVDALKIAEILLPDMHDLIHKAVGWMLREVGKRCSRTEEERFLKKHHKTMPRTMLRYALEHFPPELRIRYM